MRVSWCSRHRGVMRISFFDPPPPHFNNPCPRCGEELNQMVKWQWDSKEQGRQELREQGRKVDIISYGTKEAELREQEPIPIGSDDYNYHLSREGYWSSTYIPSGKLCSCCRFFSVRPEVDLCGWCVDCPIRYCDVPDKFKRNRRKII